MTEKGEKLKMKTRQIKENKRERKIIGTDCRRTLTYKEKMWCDRRVSKRKR